MLPKQEWILLDDDPKLRQPSQVVSFPLTDQIWSEINKMIAYVDACYQNKSGEYQIRDGIALAAPQIGLMYQIIYLHFDDENNIEQRYLLANPKIINESYEKTYIENGEGCLSVDHEVCGIVPRHSMIIVKAFDLFKNQQIEIKASGLLSICLQHEIDHLNGVLFYDHINPFNKNYVDPKWKKII